jgi:hypothetical protein
MDELLEKIFTLRLPARVIVQLGLMAKKRNTSVGEEIRKALKRHLSDDGRKR